MHIYIVVFIEKSEPHELHWDKMERLTEYLSTFAELHDKEIITQKEDDSEPIYEGIYDGYNDAEDHPFLVYKGHFIYVIYNGFDFIDRLVFCLLREDSQCIMLTDKPPYDDMNDNNNLYYAKEKDITETYIDDFIKSHS